MSLLWVDAVRQVLYYHGTTQRFSPGDILVPSAQTGNVASGISSPSQHVFVTKYKRHAGDYAANAAHGYEGARVYQVEPLGDLSDDPLELGSGYRTSHARVIRELHPKEWSRGKDAYGI